MAVIMPVAAQITYIIQNHVMHLSAVKRIICWSVELLESIVGCFITTLIVVHVMVSQALEKWYIHLLYSLVIIFKEFQVIPGYIPHCNAMNQCSSSQCTYYFLYIWH